MNENKRTTNDLLSMASDLAINYLNEIDHRAVAPSPEDIERLIELGGQLPEEPSDPSAVIKMLDQFGSPATMATAGARFFGFVVGGAMPVTVAANWLAGAWDQNAPVSLLSPTGTACEKISIGWLVDLLGLPNGTWGGLVTGATAANLTGLAAARHAILSRQGWDVAAKGIFGAPKMRVVVGEEVHISVLLGLRVLGFGRDDLIRVPTDNQGRMRSDALPDLDENTIVCIQVGNINSGAFDPAEEICDQAKRAGAWVHVDGAFGIWAAATPQKSALAKGVENADSWATDAHKWLNVPYDSGLVFVREARHLLAAMSSHAAYLIEGDKREPCHYVPEMSRRARGLEIWAALRSLGRIGLSDLIERCCRLAVRFAAGLQNEGLQVLNDVVLNQVLVKFGDQERTRRVIRRIQAEGTCWCGETIWQGQVAMRISVSSWATTGDDVEKSLAAILRIAAQEAKGEK